MGYAMIYGIISHHHRHYQSADDDGSTTGGMVVSGTWGDSISLELTFFQSSDHF